MRGHSKWVHPLLLAAGLLFLSTAAQAQVRYVASTGIDGNPCTKAAACRTLQRAIDVTAAGGEVRVVDSGDFGAATIGKSLTVSADDATIFGHITINAAGATVVLRGLGLNGTGITAEGIEIQAAAVVHIERCEIEHFYYGGIYFAAAGAELFVNDSMVRDNGGAGLTLYDASHPWPNVGLMRASIDNSSFENNWGGDGLLLSGGTTTVTRTTLSGNAGSGVASGLSSVHITNTVATHNAYAGYLLQASVSIVESSVAEDNQYGLTANGTSDKSVTISNSTFVNNTTWGIGALGDVTARTRGNNTVVDNGTDVSGPLTPLAGQ